MIGHLRVLTLALAITACAGHVAQRPASQPRAAPVAGSEEPVTAPSTHPSVTSAEIRAHETAAAVVDDAPVGAVPIPAAPEVMPLEEIDTTVTVGDLLPRTARWERRTTLRHRGRVLIALSVSSPQRLRLAVLDVTDPQHDYPGTFETYDLGPLGGDREESHVRYGNAFLTRDRHPDGAKGVEAIKFAVRVLPETGGTRRQVVVYVRGRSMFVIERLVGEPSWTPRLRIDAPRATEIVAMNPGWH